MAKINACIPYFFFFFYEFQSYVAGCHVYKDICAPTLGKKLSTAGEPENHHDKYALKVLKENEVVGHVPRDISKYCTSALLCGGTIKCEITRKNKTNLGMGLKSRVNIL